MSHARYGLVLAVLLASLRPATALAHGDEQHAALAIPEIDPQPTQAAGGLGDVYEVLLKYAPRPAGRPTPLRVFVADGASNEPIPGAEVLLTLTGAEVLKVAARPSDTPGIYQAELSFPAAGAYAAVASVTRGEHIDLVTLGTIAVGAGADTDAADEAHTASALLRPGVGPAAALAALALFLLGGVALGVRWERRRTARVRHA